MDVKIENMERIRVLGMRGIGPYSQVKFLWPKMFEYAASHGWVGDDTEMVGLSYDDPDTVDQETLRYDACITRDADGDDVMKPIVIEAGRYGVYRHVGPYELIGLEFDRLIDFLVLHQQRELRDSPCLELYRNDPTHVPPSEYVTDLAVPIV